MMRLEIIVSNHGFIDSVLNYPIVILAGPNGAGKSTILREIALHSIPNIKHLGQPPQYSVYVDGQYLRPILINHQSIQANYIPLNRAQLISPQNESTNVGPDYDSFTAAFQPNVVGRASLYSITKIREIITERDRKQYETQDPKTVERLYRSIFARLQTRELKKLSVAFLFYHEEFARRKYSGSSLEQIYEDLGPAPWIKAQNAIDELGIPYEFQVPDICNEMPAPGQYLLKRKVDNAYIQGDRLSLGEQAALSIYDLIAGEAQENCIYLFDDIDGLLHPPLLRRFVNVVNKLMLDLKSLALWVTHSPVLVQICSKSHCYFLDHFGAAAEPIEHAALIERLSDGELVVKGNTNTVFVEGQDHSFYNDIFRNLTTYKIIDPKRSVRFISPVSHAFSGSSNNFVVNDVVSVLHGSGFGMLFQGLIDHDKGQIAPAQGVERISRYSVENYWADPLNVYAWYLDSKFEHVPNALKFDEVTKGGSQKMVKALSINQLQLIVDFFSDSIIDQLDPKQKVEFAKYNSKSPIEIHGVGLIEYRDFLLRSPGKEIINILRKLDGSINRGNLRDKFLQGSFWPTELLLLMKKFSG